MLGWVYIFLFALQVYWLIRSCIGRKRIWPVLMANVFCICLSCFLLWYFDTLPGYGMMPGFAFFPEVFASLCSAAAFAVLSIVTLLCLLLRKPK